MPDGEVGQPLILADDLTGAADCAVAFAHAGVPSRLVLDAQRWVRLTGAAPAGVMALDANTRVLTPSAAYRRVLALARRLNGCGAPAWRRRFYKKIDSLLRGNWVDEVRALRDSGAGMAIVAPAFPQTGRVTRGARQLVRELGAPVGHGTWCAGDVAGQLEAVGLKVRRVPTRMVRGEAAGLARCLAEAAVSAIDAVVCDAQDEVALKAIAGASVRLRSPAFWVGSGGLARALAGGWASRYAPPAPPRTVCRRVLIVVGSRAQISRRQARTLATERSVAEVVVPAALLHAGAHHRQWTLWRKRCDEGFRRGDLLLCIGDSGSGVDAALSASLADLAAAFAGRADGLILTGGDTARAMLLKLAIPSLTLYGETEPGVVLAHTDSPAPVQVVTKSGAFGGPETLTAAYRQLKGVLGDRSDHAEEGVHHE